MYTYNVPKNSHNIVHLATLTGKMRLGRMRVPTEETLKRAALLAPLRQNGPPRKHLSSSFFFFKCGYWNRVEFFLIYFFNQLLIPEKKRHVLLFN